MQVECFVVLRELETVIVLLEVILAIFICRLCRRVVLCLPCGQAAVAVKAMGTEGESEARAEEIEIATARLQSDRSD